MQPLPRSFGLSLAFVALPFLLSGCGGSDDGGGGGGPASFVGTWSYTSGTLTAACTGIAAQTLALTGNVTVTAGSSSDLVYADAYCTLTLGVSGTKATASPSGQTCSIMLALAQGNATLAGTYSAFVFTSADGKTGHVSATLAGTGSLGLISIPCTITETADLQKL